MSHATSTDAGGSCQIAMVARKLAARAIAGGWFDDLIDVGPYERAGDYSLCGDDEDVAARELGLTRPAGLVSDPVFLATLSVVERAVVAELRAAVGAGLIVPPGARKS